MKTKIRKIKKRILSLLLCISMAIAIMPIPAYADGGNYTVITDKEKIDISTMNSLLSKDWDVYRITVSQDFYGNKTYAYIGGNDNETFKPEYGKQYRIEGGVKGSATTLYTWYWDGYVTFKYGYSVEVKVEGITDTEKVSVDINGSAHKHGSWPQVIKGDQYMITPQSIDGYDYTVSAVIEKYNSDTKEYEVINTLASAYEQPLNWVPDKKPVSLLERNVIKIVYTDIRTETELVASNDPIELSGDNTNILNSLSQEIKLKSGDSELTGKNIYFKNTDGNELTADFLLEQAGGDVFIVRAYFDGDSTYKPASAEFQVKVNAAFQVNNIDRDFTGSPIKVDLNETGHSNGEVIYYDGNKQSISAPTNPGNYYYRVKDGSLYSNYGSLCIKPIAPSATSPVAKENLIYNGAEQELITAYSSEHGTWWYTDVIIFGNPTFYWEKFPKAKDAGTYKWWCKFEGKTGYSDIEPFPIEVTISPKPITVDLASSNITKTYDGTTILENAEVALKGIEDGDTVQATATITYNDKNAGTDKSISANNIVLSGSSAKNYTAVGVSATGTGVIVPRPVTVKVNDASKIYGDLDPSYTYELTENTSLVENDVLTGIEYTRVAGKNVGEYAITAKQPQNANPNYDITFVGGTLTINQKEVNISWEPTTFLPYTGSSLVPKANVTNLEAGDECILTTEVVETADGAGIIPGTWTAKVTSLSNDNYKLPESGERVEVPFEIINGYQNYAPDGISGVNETIDGKADGKITGVDSTMEYCKEGETTYTAISGTEVTDLAAGTYYVRYAAKTYYNASPDKEVAIGAGRKLTVTVPTTQTGYTITAEDTGLVWNGSTTITFALADGYSKTNAFAVKVNGNKVELNAANQYVITNAQENITVTVEGVADTTAPTAEITLATNKWNTFLNNITFGLFFKETQSVTVSAEDVNTGSGLDKVYYYLANEELIEDEVKALADWKEYDGAFSINPNNEYIIYAKVVDKAGNATYISSDGIVLDAIVPVITGIENNGTYYGDTEFGVDESYIDTVTVDGNTVELTDGKHTITADGIEHTIVVTDKAGNSATVKVTVITIASLDDTIKNIKTTDVKSTDKEDIQEILDFVNSLIDSGKDFTDEEDEQLSDIKSNAESLLKQIDDAAKADDTDNTEKAKDITSDNVTTDDKADLEKAKDDLEKALEDYKDNLTEDEKKAIEDEIDRIDEALEVIGNVEAVEEQINNLPENITKNDEDAIKAADDAYNALTDYEKSLVDEDAKKALDNANAALAELNKPADPNSPATGDNSNIWLWFALLFVSGTGVFGITLYDRKRKATSKR